MMVMQSGRDEQGAAGVIVAVSVSTLIALAALGVDLGRVYALRARVSAGVDAAAMAGAQALPNNPPQAETLVREYLNKNGLSGAAAAVTVDSGQERLQVAVNEALSMSFGRVIGINTQNVAASATARVGVLSGVTGTAPLAVRKDDYVAGEQVVLKMDPFSSQPAVRGNFMALAMGGPGAEQYEENIRSGYPGWIRVGDWLDTEPGNIAGPTKRAIQDRINGDLYSTWDRVGRLSTRLLKVPVIDDLNLNGKGQVQVVGLAIFFLDEVKGNAHSAEVTGRFVRYVADGELSGAAADFGARVIKLES